MSLSLSATQRPSLLKAESPERRKKEREKEREIELYGSDFFHPEPDT